MKNKTKISLALIALMMTFTLVYTGCGEDDELGIGPVKEVKLNPQVDQNLAATGKQLFDVKCVACHKFDEKLVGPPLSGVTKRRKPEWIMNMMLNPDQMIKENETAKALFAQYLVPMTFQNVTQDDSRAILEYFRSLDK